MPIEVLAVIVGDVSSDTNIAMPKLATPMFRMSVLDKQRLVTGTV